MILKLYIWGRKKKELQLFAVSNGKFCHDHFHFSYQPYAYTITCNHMTMPTRQQLQTCWYPSYIPAPRNTLTQLTASAVMVPAVPFFFALSYATWLLLSPQRPRVTIDMHPLSFRFYCSMPLLTHRQEPCWLLNVSHWLDGLTHSPNSSVVLTDHTLIGR